MQTCLFKIGMGSYMVCVAQPTTQEEGPVRREAAGILGEVFGQRTKSGCDLQG